MDDNRVLWLLVMGIMLTATGLGFALAHLVGGC